MTPEERESFYDSDIAPQLLALAKKCHDAGLQFLAEVEWAPGEGGTTAEMNEHASLGFRLVHVAARACGNVDSIFIWLSQYATKHGHSSIYLKMLGIPVSPGVVTQESGSKALAPCAEPVVPNSRPPRET